MTLRTLKRALKTSALRWNILNCGFRKVKGLSLTLIFCSYKLSYIHPSIFCPSFIYTWVAGFLWSLSFINLLMLLKECIQLELSSRYVYLLKLDMAI